MLSVKNLVKIYKSKGGVIVNALDGINIDFPEKGMVFLLGKSGSGKSTLLNVTGGLDIPTSGEVIVKGKSSKDFAPSDWDSYRNTYIGFVFQEYNILDEFTVEQNIALALQLQNKNNDIERVNEILREVDLEGYAKRKPNTLSGGQKQRVAIARALIKSPEIIMADEPTGALDSETGKQVFDTLKKLSLSRLVIVVSHDRDFAETYADRIIELEDGKVIEDNSREIIEENTAIENVSYLDNDTITVKDWKKLSNEDIKRIISVMSQNEGETVITKDQKEITEIKKTHKKTNTVKAFSPTKNKQVSYNGESAKFIKSKLPFVHAFKVALGAIKTKPIRLVFTILLSILAFTFFGVASTLMLYSPRYSMSTAFENSEFSAYVIEKEYQAQNVVQYLDANYKLVSEVSGTMEFRGAYSEEDIRLLNDNSYGMNFSGLIDFGYYKHIEGGFESDYYTGRSFILQNQAISLNDQYFYCNDNVSGFYDGGEQSLLDRGFTLLGGRYPEKANEIAISEYHFGFFEKAIYSDIDEVDDILGKEITISDFKLTVTGVYNVGNFPEKFDVLRNVNEIINLTPTEREKLVIELVDFVSCSFHSVVFVSPSFYETYRGRFVEPSYRSGLGINIGNSRPEISPVKASDNITAYTKNSVWQYDDLFTFVDFDGNVIEEDFGKQDLYVNASLLHNAIVNAVGEYIAYLPNASDYQEVIDIAKKITSTWSSLTKEEYISCLRAFRELNINYLNNSGVSRKKVIKNVDGESIEIVTKGFYISECKSTYSIPFISDEVFDELALTMEEYFTQNDSHYIIVLDFEPDVKAQKYGKLISLTDGSYKQAYYVLGQFSNFNNRIKNSVYDFSKQITDTIDLLKIIFSVITGVFAVFASLMLFNFISVSISSKTREIGILRAIGARGIDVFKIFILEALMITGTCFILSTVASLVICSLANKSLIGSMIGMSVLNFGVLSVLMLLAMTVFISFVATLSPVIKASKKSPVDSIRSL